jgi:D-3-phosphoglycerate dehydrogenase
MPRLNILNAEPENYSAEAASILAKLGEVTNGPMSRAGLLAALPEVDVLIVRLAHQIDREALDQGKHLKVIVTATTGLDHIDIDYARSKGVTVLSLRGETEFLRSIPATAEHTWALLLALVRYIPAASQSVLSGVWVRDQFKGHDLAGKRLGILGLGRIGEKVARYGQAFDMPVLAFDPYRADWPVGVERLASMEDLLSRSQVFSIHVPLNDETENLIGVQELSLLPPGAILVNTSRGQVIEEKALIRALEASQLGGVALDVICDERSESLSSSPLLEYARRHPNLLITPHIGGATYESMEATEIFMACKLEKYLTESMQ